MVSDNDALRLRRLVFYAADIDRINAVLLAFVKKANAQSALVIDKEGHMVARQGFFKQDTSALSALVSGSFASTREVARLLGEPEFRVLFHQGQGQSIHITLLGERTLCVTVFGSAIKAGMIQVLCKELAVQLEAILNEAAKRKPEDQEKQNEGLGKNFSDEMKNQLDALFGNL
jgi:predicted regulator of Ras-like GTPase activity (Roadblock/LC7/MglB family)